MEQFIPKEKLSKKEQQQFNQRQRKTWGVLNPVTRKPQNPKAYNRKKSQSWMKDNPSFETSFYFVSFNYAIVRAYIRESKISPFL